jgi:hypothetical protein
MHTSFDFLNQLFFNLAYSKFAPKSIKWCKFSLTEMIEHNYPHSHNNNLKHFKVYKKYLLIKNKFLSTIGDILIKFSFVAAASLDVIVIVSNNENTRNLEIK